MYDVVMEILLDVVMEKNSLEEKTSLDNTITTETNQVIVLFTCLRGYSRSSDGTDITGLRT